jgi:glycosyltransferase involved in cell wall biosynthesis
MPVRNKRGAMKKLLYLVTEDWYFCLHRLPLARAARDAGYRVIVATNLDRHRELLEQEGFQVEPMAWSRSSMSPLQAIREIRQIVRVYRKYKPDIVHHVALKPSLYGSTAARWLGLAPVVNNFAGLGQAFSGTGFRAALLRSVLTGAFRLLIRRRCSIVIVENSDDRQYLIARAGLPERGVALILGVGVNEQNFACKDKRESPIPVVTMVSRLLWPKGVGELVEAGRILRSRQLAFRIWLVGNPDEASRVSVPVGDLQAWNADGALEWLGHHNDIPRILSESSIAVLPSYYREGIPRSLLEAASCGLPLVTTDMPGCREIVRHEVNGLLVPPRDPVALADALEKLIRDPELRKRMGEAGRKMVLDRFTERHIVGQTLEVYRELLAKTEA